LIYSIIY